MGVCNCSLYCCTLLYVLYSIAIILMGKRELIALLNLSSWCLVMVERLFLTVPRGCLQLVIVVFPDHTHLLFLSNFAQFSLFESKFDHLIPYVNEGKSLSRVSGQDPLICHRFRSSQRFWHFSPLSRLGKKEQFYSIFVFWVQIWPPFTLCK